MPRRLLADQALLPDGWARDVLLEIDDGGTLHAVRAGWQERQLQAGAAGTEDPPPPSDPPPHRIPGIVLPGLQNLHSHAFQRAMVGLTERGSATGDSFWTWRDRMYAFMDRMEPEDVEVVAAQLYVEMLEAGYTAVGEFHYLHHDRDGRPYADPAEMSRRIVAAAGRTGIGLTLLPVLYMTGDFGGVPAGEGQRRFLHDPPDLLDLVGTLRRDLSDDADRRTGIALHSLRAVPPEALSEAVEGATSLDPRLPVHIHVAEQRREVEACLAWSGSRPVAWLLDHAPVDDRWCLIHATHLDRDEVRRVARSGAVAGLCPTTEANLGDGLFPLEPYLEEGGRLGVGSDSHVSVSPVEELRWLEYGQRLTTGRRNVAGGAEDRSTGRRLLELTLEGGEAALRRGASVLAEGRRADLVVLDPGHPALAGRTGDDLLDAWIFGSGTPAVRDVMVGGRWVVREGRHPERDTVARRYREVARRLATP